MDNILECRQAAFGYGGKAVLSGVDMNVARGAFVGILGHNGSGKTTMLRTLLGLNRLVKGRVHWPAGRPAFGYVPQKETLDPIYPLTTYAVAAMGGWRAFGRGCGEAFIMRCLADCGMRALAGRPFSALSGGQKQRVLIARALASSPEILALDEPLAGVDVTTQKAVLALLGRLKTERGLTVLMVSHRVRAERGLFTHIAWCGGGAVQYGPSEEMLKTSRAAEVFGSELTCN